MTLRPAQIARPLLVALMFACVMLSIAQLIRAFIPAWNAAYAVGAIFFIALEAYFAVGLAHRMRLSGRERWAFRLAEWTIILVSLKLFSYVSRGWGDLLADLATWEADLINLFSIEYIIMLVLALCTWLGAGDTARWLDDLTQPIEGGFNPYQSLSAIQTLYFTGGVVLLVMAGLTQVGLQAVLRMDRPPVGGVILNVLIYFVSGLLVLSQARMEVLHTQWRVSKIEVAPGIRSRWIGLAVAMLIVVALLALLLPTRYSLGLLDSMAALLAVLGNAGLALGYMLNFAFFLVLGLLTALLSLLLGRPMDSPTPPPAPPPILPTMPPTPAGPDWLILLRSLLFWAVTLGILGYALGQFISARRDWWLALAERRGLGWLVRWLQAIWSRMAVVASAASVALRQSLAQVGRRLPTPPRRWLRLGSLSPRELIMYFYLSLIRRAAEGGLPRSTAQTAREYSERLRSSLPDADADLDTLTDAFETARYSPRPVAREDTRTPRQSWERLKRQLRGKLQ